jgi:hypothetical protein
MAYCPMMQMALALALPTDCFVDPSLNLHASDIRWCDTRTDVTQRAECVSRCRSDSRPVR